MKRFNVVASTLGFLACGAAMPAMAFPLEATCEGWSTAANWGESAYAVADLTVYSTANGQLTPVATGADDELQLTGGEIMLGALWSESLSSGPYVAFMTVTVYSEATDTDVSGHPEELTYEFPSSKSFELDCTPPPPPPPTEFIDGRTPGYWKNHAESWGATTLTVGGNDYSQACLLDFFDVPTHGDIRVILIHHLVASKLNFIAGTDPSAVTGAPEAGSTAAENVSAADAYLADTNTVITCDGLTGAKPKGGAKAYPRDVKDGLDAYNNNFTQD